MDRDYYQVLGVERNATPSEIKTAYRKRAREYHPDVSGACDATDRFTEINYAYVTLRSAQSRHEYDALLMSEIYNDSIKPSVKELWEESQRAKKPSFLDRLREWCMWGVIIFMILLYLSTYL